MSNAFQFKQFTVAQDRCAMKVGTDGVLLGAWTPIKHSPNSILDIGAGTGLISLMLAQRAFAELIDGVEIHPEAYEQCVENFEASPWNDRLFCYHASLQEFVEEIEDTYDLIVSNPPFYAENYSSGNTARDLARQNQSLPIEELLEAVASLLSKEGVFSVIIPFKEEDRILTLAQKKRLFPFQITRVKGTSNSEIKRSLIAFSFKSLVLAKKELILETSRHQYTAEYIALTKDFYLKM